MRLCSDGEARGGTPRLQLNEVFDLALRSYLALGKAEPGSSVVEQSFGVLRFPSAETRRLLEEQDGLFES